MRSRLLDYGFRGILWLLLLSGACKSSSENSEPEAVPIFSSPGKFFSIKGRVTPQTGSLHLLSITSLSSFRASRPNLPTCSSSIPNEEQEGLNPGDETGVVVNLNRAKITSPTDFLVEIPARLGPALNVCGFAPLQQPFIEVTALNQGGALEKFRVLVEIGKFSEDTQDLSISIGGEQSAPAKIIAQTTNMNIHLSKPVTQPTRLNPSVSFNQVWEKIQATRLPNKPLPNEEGLSTGAVAIGVLGNAIGIDARDERVRADQLRAVTSTLDKKADAPKAFHAFGVCAKARWRIAENSSYSGLFRQKTNLPAIVRFSTGGNNTSTHSELGFHRMPAMAIKIFPGDGTDSNRPTETRNLVMFDEKGPKGNSQPWFLFDELSGPNSHFFANWIFGTDLVAKGTVNSFGRLLFDPRHLPLTASASVNSDGSYEKSEALAIPKFIKITYNGKRKAEKFTDLREELLNYTDNELQFKVAVFKEGSDPDLMNTSDGELIGELSEISAPILSSYCDRSLFFHHAPH